MNDARLSAASLTMAKTGQEISMWAADHAVAAVLHGKINIDEIATLHSQLVELVQVPPEVSVAGVERPTPPKARLVGEGSGIFDVFSPNPVREKL